MEQHYRARQRACIAEAICDVVGATGETRAQMMRQHEEMSNEDLDLLFEQDARWMYCMPEIRAARLKYGFDAA